MEVKTKIVLIEDDPLLMRAYHDALTAEGYAVEIFFNADDALQALIEMPEKPALILSDIMMPHMNGLQLLEKTREYEDLKKIPFFIITSLTQKEHAEKAQSLGAAAYVAKDQHTIKELLEKVSQVVKGGASRPE